MVRLKASLANLVVEIYASGAELLVDGQRVGIKGNPPQFIYNEVEENKKELLEALRGDPLEKCGWEVRTALYREALKWLDERTPEEAKEKVTQTLCQPFVPDKLNKAWVEGTFEEFRAALKDYVRTGLRAARGNEQTESEARMVMKR